MQCKSKSKNITCSKHMSETAGRSSQLMDPESADQVASFVKDQMVEDGGFKGRTESSDLYYTLFGMECLQALGHNLPLHRLTKYLAGFNEGNGLDFVHITCLVRCLAKLTDKTKHAKKLDKSFAGVQGPRGAGSLLIMHPVWQNTMKQISPVNPHIGPPCQGEKSPLVAEGKEILQKLEQYRSGGCGFRMTPDAKHDSIYATFLAFLAYEDTGKVIRDPQSLTCCFDKLKTKDGAYADQPGLSFGTTTVTAAAAVLLSYLGEKVDPSVGKWLLSRRSKYGGFLATPNASTPDLLSTATALFALQTLQYPLEKIKESCLAFIEEMWADCGGFYGHIFDNTPDCEYTFYGLLSLGILTGDKG